MTDTASAAPTYEQVIAAWNARADKYNQWGELGEDEKIEWAVACAKATPPAVVEPLTDEQIVGVMHSIPIDPPMHVAVVEGDDAVRTLQWNRDVAAFAYPVGTLLYAARSQAKEGA